MEFSPFLCSYELIWLLIIFEEMVVSEMTIILSLGKSLLNKMRYKSLLRLSSKAVVQELLIKVSSHSGSQMCTFRLAKSGRDGWAWVLKAVAHRGAAPRC